MKTGEILGWKHVLSRQKMKTCCEWFSLQRKKRKKEKTQKQNKKMSERRFAFVTAPIEQS